MPSSNPQIQFTNPYKECADFVGMRQCGKTNLIAYLLVMLANGCNVWVFDTLNQVAKAFSGYKPPNLTIIPVNWATKDDQFKAACRAVWLRGNVVFVIDEVHLFHAKKKTLPEHLAILLNQGGNKNIAVWVASQRCAQVHNDILAACNHHFIFKLFLPQDLDYMCDFVPKEFIKGDPNDPTKPCARNLEQYHFIYFRVGAEPQFFKPVKKMY